jgi:hypothetical protein
LNSTKTGTEARIVDHEPTLPWRISSRTRSACLAEEKQQGA